MKPNKPMMIALCVVGTLLIAYAMGRILFAIQFNNQVKQLFSLSKPITDQKFSYTQLEDLPAPVQRYFKRVMKQGQPYISCARLTHDGQFKTDLKKGWINIEGEQYFTTQKPGFIWKGTTAFFTARDMFVADKGRLVVSLLSLINIIDAKGEQYNQGELLRWLAESVWFPTNLLPSKNVEWTAIDSFHATLTFNYQHLSLVYEVTFNEMGEITQLETKRYMDETHLETWIIKLQVYKEMNGILIPTQNEVFWKLGEEELCYAKFNVKKLEYDNPFQF